jgi:hypothetical protein
MLDYSLPMNLYHNNEKMILKYKNCEFQVEIPSKDKILKFSYKLPNDTHQHIANWFTENRLPNLKQCSYNYVYINDDKLCFLVGYREKYRKYYIPLVFDLESKTYYQSSQPVYFNYNQNPIIDKNKIVNRTYSGGLQYEESLKTLFSIV